MLPTTPPAIHARFEYREAQERAAARPRRRPSMPSPAGAVARIAAGLLEIEAGARPGRQLEPLCHPTLWEALVRRLPRSGERRSPPAACAGSSPRSTRPAWSRAWPCCSAVAALSRSPCALTPPPAAGRSSCCSTPRPPAPLTQPGRTGERRAAAAGPQVGPGPARGLLAGATWAAGHPPHAHRPGPYRGLPASVGG
jgi:hypothetical protein